MAILLCNSDLDTGAHCKVMSDEEPAGQSYLPPGHLAGP